MNRFRFLSLTALALSLSCPLVLAAPMPAPDLTPPVEAVPETVPDAPPGVAGQEGLNATLWVQTSTEARIAARQAYRLARRQLQVALKDKRWSAAVEQGRNFRDLPPAIIVDLDETILDNSPYQARLVRDNAVYTEESWQNWVGQASAPAIAGAIPFLKYAAARGVDIFYVSNRSAAGEAATRANLKRIGAPVGDKYDAVLLNGERPAWTSDKTSRRAFVAQSHRVLLLIGDDMNDFVPAKPLTLGQRDALLQKYEEFWGERWILLSNPLYGSWEGALFDYRYDLSREETMKRKYDALQFDEPGALETPSAPEAPKSGGSKNGSDGAK